MKKNVKPIMDDTVRTHSALQFRLQATIETVQQLTGNQYSHNSVVAMTSDWNRFATFCQDRAVSSLPASITAVRLFLEKEARTRKFATLKRYNVTIALFHTLHRYSDPCSHRQIRFVLQQLRQDKHGDARQANAISKQHLNQLDTLMLKDDSVIAVRDLAIYHLMFECVLKRAELKNLSIEQLEQVSDQYVVTIGESHYRLSDEASLALERWLMLIPSVGYCFRRIDRHGNIGEQKLDDSSIYRILRRASDRLGLDREHRFTAQSARVGGVQLLQQQGYNLKDIQSFGRWLSPAMPAQYLNKADTAKKEMGRFRVIKPWE
jgi:hypothetical protein